MDFMSTESMLGSLSARWKWLDSVWHWCSL